MDRAVIDFIVAELSQANFSSRSGLKKQGYRIGITPIEVDSRKPRRADHSAGAAEKGVINMCA